MTRSALIASTASAASAAPAAPPAPPVIHHRDPAKDSRSMTARIPTVNDAPTRRLLPRPGARTALTAVVVLGLGAASPAMARQVRAIRMVPAAPTSPAPKAPAVTIAAPPAGAPGATGTPGAASATDENSVMSSEELDRVRALYDALDPEEQTAMVTEYEAVGIDLRAMLAGTGSGTADDPNAAAPPELPLPQLILQKNFQRTPASVLGARTALGLGGAVGRPAADAGSVVLADWLHSQVMAGEWDSLAWFLAERAGTDASAIYAHILQSTNQGDPLLLPEEVLAIADACPGLPTAWQIDVLGQLLKTAASTTSTGPMLAQLRSGTRLFGAEGDARRARTANLLVKAGLPIEAYAYLPPLDRARREGDAGVILGHGQYHEGRAAAGRGADVELDRRQAFALYGEAALMTAAPEDARREGLNRAMDMLPDMPESVATPWLDEVFRQESLAPAALEKIALDALTLSDRTRDESRRTRTILIMKTAVQTLLASDRVDRQAMRVPLRMLTTALVTEAEKMVAARPDPRRGDLLVREKAVLLRAIPDAAWLDTIEDSLAVRAERAFIGLATVADETDRALDLLQEAVARHPEQGQLLADDFLDNWTRRLRPNSDSDRNAAMSAAFMIFGGRSSVPAAPLTRGRQARNLERLDRVLEIVREIGVDPRGLDNVVGSFRACHSRAEAFAAADIERVLGSIEELPAPTAASLAEAMRGGLGGDWRSRETQQMFGLRRNAAEIAQVVADGYAVAMRLIDRAVADEPGSWAYAVTRAALAYDRLEHRRSTQGEDFAEYEQLRSASFDAFADAANGYAAAAAAGGVPASINVHLAWFNAAVGATQLNQLTRDNILYEGSERDTQINRVRESILAMSPSQAEEHIGLFVQQMVDGLGSVNPEVKPRLVKHALRVVGDHPLGAPLRRIAAVHDDLISNEIALRMTLDGADRVGSGRPFGAVLAIRYTNAVDRETDGFSKYLRNQVWTYFGNTGRTLDYRDRLERSIERSLGEGFLVDSIAFFDPLFPSREVRERGEVGWQEKPLAYVVLSAVDPSIERIPSVQMDLDFVDTTGPIILAIESNAPIIDAADTPQNRPVLDLVVTQTLDPRAMRSSEDGREIVLEVRATGRGVMPELGDLLSGVEEAVAGYVIPADGIETHPLNALSEGNAVENPFAFAASAPEEDEDATPPGPDPDGVYRTDFERAWTIRYVPGEGTAGDDFRLPALREGVDGTLISQTFDDLDIVLASGPTVALVGGGTSPTLVFMMMLAGLLVPVAAVVLLRRNSAAHAVAGPDDLLPTRATPMAAIAALQRIDRDYGGRLGDARRAELATDIHAMERQYFGPGAGDDAGETYGDVRAVVDRWATAARGG